MTTPVIPLLVEPEQLQTQLGNASLLIVDLCKPETYAKAHVPGAIHLDYMQIVAIQKPVMGLLPDASTLSQIFSSIGLTTNKHVIAYDDEGGGRASRLLWTLDAIGHQKASLLNGGINAWYNENHPTDNTPVHAIPSNYTATIVDTPIAEQNFICEHLNDDTITLLDSRSPEEFSGIKKYAARGGRIPGAINLDWFNVMDKTRNMRLKPKEELQTLMNEHGFSKDKIIITYCQSHHRSALTYFALKQLGYPNVKGYPGSWSDWGNSEELPVETG